MVHRGPDTESGPARTRNVHSYLAAWRRSFNYRGSSARREYWVFVIVHWLILVPAIAMLPWVFGANSAINTLTGIVFLGHFAIASIVTLPLTIRRVRDATSSGWFTFLIFASPGLILAIACCPRYDAKSLAAIPGGYWDVWRKSADYLGLAKRGEFWGFTLTNLVALIGLVAFGNLVLFAGSVGNDDSFLMLRLLVSSLYLAALSYILVSSWPWLALVVRRVRDVTNTGWLTLVGLLFPFGTFAVLIICLIPSRKQKLPTHAPVDVKQSVESATYEDDDPWGRNASGRAKDSIPLASQGGVEPVGDQITVNSTSSRSASRDADHH